MSLLKAICYILKPTGLAQYSSIISNLLDIFFGYRRAGTPKESLTVQMLQFMR